MDVRKEIEFVMENFRDHERDCKTKGYKFKTLLPANYFDDMDDEDEVSETLSSQGLNLCNQSDEFDEDDTLDDTERLDKDRKRLNDFLDLAFIPFISKTEAELETLKNKKPKTGSKKQKVQINIMSQKLEISRKQREKLEAVVNNIESIGYGQIGTLRNVLKKYVDNWDDEEGRKNLESECHRLIELADKNAVLAKLHQSQEQKSNSEEEEKQNLLVEKFSDVVKMQCPVKEIKLGNMLDVED